MIITLTVTDNGAYGTATVNADDGTITYTPNPDSYGFDTYTYTIDDGNGGITSTTVDVTVNPKAVDDFAVTDEDIPLTTAVLDNDTDLDEIAVTTITTNT